MSVHKGHTASCCVRPAAAPTSPALLALCFRSLLLAVSRRQPGVMGQMDELPPASLALADDGADLKVAAIPHAAVADLCVGVLGAPNAACATLTAMTVPSGEGADTWAPLLAKVAPDRRAFRTDMLEEHKKAVRVGALGGGAILALAAAVMGFTLKALALRLIRGIQLASGIEPTRLVAGLVVGLLIARAV